MMRRLDVTIAWAGGPGGVVEFPSEEFLSRARARLGRSRSRCDCCSSGPQVRWRRRARPGRSGGTCGALFVNALDVIRGLAGDPGGFPA